MEYKFNGFNSPYKITNKEHEINPKTGRTQKRYNCTTVSDNNIMTGKDLIEYIQKWGLEDYKIEVQLRDEGGYYYGTDEVEPHIIEAGENSKYAMCKDYNRLVL